MKPPFLRLILIAGLLATAALAILPRLMVATNDGTQIGGAFTLVDHTGRQVSEADYRGKIMLVFFGYSFCPDVCPTTLATVAQAVESLTPSEQNQLAPLFITVDPERDTVPKMADYVANFSPAIVGLTGSPEQIKAVSQAYRVYARKVEEGNGPYSVDHSAILYLMDGKGRYVTHFDPSVTSDRLVAAIRKQLGS